MGGENRSSFYEYSVYLVKNYLMATYVRFNRNSICMKRCFVLVVLLSSCRANYTVVYEYDKNYALLNVLTNSLIEAHEDEKNVKHLYLRKDAANGHFRSILERDFKKYFYEDEFELIFKSGDLSYMKKQLDQPFNIDFTKIKSRKIRAYTSRLSPNSSVDYNGKTAASKDIVEVDYAVSRPVFTQDEQWGMVYVLNKSGISVDILKKERERWEFYRMIPIGIF